MDTYDEIYGRMKNVYEQETGDSFNEKKRYCNQAQGACGRDFQGADKP